MAAFSGRYDHFFRVKMFLDLQIGSHMTTQTGRRPIIMLTYSVQMTIFCEQGVRRPERVVIWLDWSGPIDPKLVVVCLLDPKKVVIFRPGQLWRARNEWSYSSYLGTYASHLLLRNKPTRRELSKETGPYV